MYNLLVVDDEIIIAEYISELFSNSQMMGDILLEVRQANSAVQALEIMKKIHIDIILTDISMPGMDGIEFLKRVKKDWPYAKVILMSGYDEFQYAQAAIRNDGADYILKTEGEERFITSVIKAVEELEQELRSEEIVKRAAESLKLADSMLREELIIDILEGEKYQTGTLERCFSDIDMPLDAKKPVFMVIGKVSKKERSLPTHKELYKVKTFIHEYFRQNMNCISVIYERRLIWVLQPGCDREYVNKAIAQAWVRLDSVQKLCNEMFKIHVSFSADQQPVGWGELAIKFKQLYSALNMVPLTSGDVIVIGSDGFGDHTLQYSSYERELLIDDARLSIKKMSKLDSYLMDSSEKEFLVLYDELMKPFRKLSSEYNGLKEEAFFTLVSRFLSVINKMAKPDEANDFNIRITTYPDDFNSWDDVELYFKDIARQIFNQRDSNDFQNVSTIIGFINKYVEEHINEDLSLNRFAELLHYHPFYLSRMFKEIKGESFTEYISQIKMDKARNMLLQSDMKITVIAERLGFNHSSYFTRFFKKHSGLTPQEYRNQVRISD